MTQLAARFLADHPVVRAEQLNTKPRDQRLAPRIFGIGASSERKASV